MIADQLMASVRRHASTTLVPTAARALERDLTLQGPRKTGRMLRQHTLRISGGGDIIAAELAYTAKQAGMLDRGLTAHVIRPRRPGGVLRFVSGGRVIFTRRVNWRPGAGAARARGWFTNRVRAWGRYLQDAARRG